MENIIELSKTLVKLFKWFHIDKLDIHYSKLYEMYEGFLYLSDDDGNNMEYVIYEDGGIIKK